VLQAPDLAAGGLRHGKDDNAQAIRSFALFIDQLRQITHADEPRRFLSTFPAVRERGDPSGMNGQN
jgi:hypothetical protein